MIDIMTDTIRRIFLLYIYFHTVKRIFFKRMVSMLGCSGGVLRRRASLLADF